LALSTTGLNYISTTRQRLIYQVCFEITVELGLILVRLLSLSLLFIYSLVFGNFQPVLIMKSLFIAALAGLTVAAPGRLDLFQELDRLQKRQGGGGNGGIASLVGMINSKHLHRIWTATLF
jgi:hypothetical protein